MLPHALLKHSSPSVPHSSVIILVRIRFQKEDYRQRFNYAAQFGGARPREEVTGLMVDRAIGGAELRFFGDTFDRGTVRQMVVPNMDPRCEEPHPPLPSGCTNR